MRLWILICVTMAAFAANSLLTRVAIEPGYIDPITFALIRVFSGAAVLCGIVLFKGGRLSFIGRDRMIGAVSLAFYMIGFSLAYTSLDAGVGALILFGVVQITMFSHVAVTGERPSTRQVSGATIAFIGLLIALWPDEGAQGDISGAVFMTVAGLGWAAYTISGKGSRNPLAATAANFALCLPLLLVLMFPFLKTAAPTGIALAVLCGAVTSGLGYALWYNVLTDLQQSVAAVVQLSVPIIAIVGGALLLGEIISLATVLAAALVVCGIGWAVTARSAPAGHR